MVVSEGYEIQRKVGEGEWVENFKIVEDLETYSWDDTGVVQGQTYHYRIRRFYGEYKGDWSNTITILVGVLGEFYGSGFGTGSYKSVNEIQTIFSGSGIGTGFSKSINDVSSIFFGTGLGIGSFGGIHFFPVYSKFHGFGLGEGSFSGACEIPSKFNGSGFGKSSFKSINDIISVFNGSGFGKSSFKSINDIISIFIGSGVGKGSSGNVVYFPVYGKFHGLGLGGGGFYGLGETSSKFSGTGLGFSGFSSLVHVLGSFSGLGLGGGVFSLGGILLCIKKEGEGSVKLNGSFITIPIQRVKDLNEEVVLEAVTNYPNRPFVRWLINGESNDNQTINLLMNEDTYITVYFKKLLSFGITRSGIFRFMDISEVGVSKGLVGWWSFDGNALDLTVNKNSGDVQGPTIVYGIDKLCYSFSDNYIDLGLNRINPLAFESSAITVSVWVNGSVFEDDNVCFFETIDSGFRGFELLVSDDLASMGGRSHPSDSDQYVLGDTQLQTNTWYHLVGINDYENSEQKIYVNGFLDGQREATFSSEFYEYGTPNVNSWIGNYPGGGNGFNGMLSDLRVYNRALSSEEIKILYNLTMGPHRLIQTTDRIYLRRQLKEV